MHHPSEFWHPILAQPHDDEPRLSYAEWLARRDHPLGEFIRLQCQLARDSEEEIDAERGAELEARQFRLWRQHHADWSAPVCDYVQWCSFRRGFVEEISLTTEQIRAHADDLFLRAPLQDLHLEPADLDLDQLPAISTLGHTIFLDLSAHVLGDAGLIRLAQAPFLVHVHGLNLSGCGIGDAGLLALADSPYTSRLRELYLCDNGISDVGVRHFALTPLPEQLDTFFLRDNPVSPEGSALLRRVLGDRLHDRAPVNR